ncbi:MAG: penicillin-binding transpeptidase domain-containing protein [Candidatus Rifleibacteriota bacterium]
MFSNFFKPLNLICITLYVVFMILAMNSNAVDALVFFVSEEQGTPVYTAGRAARVKVGNRIKNDAAAEQLVAIQFKPALITEKVEELVKIPEPQITRIVKEKTAQETADSAPVSELEMKSAVPVPILTAAVTQVVTSDPEEKPAKEDVVQEMPVKTGPKTSGTPSALAYIKAVAEKKWEYAELLDRYIVRYDKETYIVLTIRPTLQKQLEEIFRKYSTRIGASIIQDPASGEILAMTSCHKNQTLSIESDQYKTENWALKATFPVASIFKIITAAAGIETGKITPNSNFIAWKKSYMKVWKAFARSHNGVFGKIALKTGRAALEKYMDAFGFNKTLFFDLPVGKSIADLPTQNLALGQAAAGLNRDFLVSPMHVATIVSTVLNRGKTMKPYLVDYVVRKNQVIFRRKPFQIAQPIKDSTARDIYKMMYTTTSVGTGKKGFGGYKKCPDLARICGGKTGTLTGASPHYLYTWFGGFTKATGRDMCIVTLVGQQNHGGTKASSIAGQIAYELYLSRQKTGKQRLASK